MPYVAKKIETTIFHPKSLHYLHLVYNVLFRQTFVILEKITGLERFIRPIDACGSMMRSLKNTFVPAGHWQLIWRLLPFLLPASPIAFLLELSLIHISEPTRQAEISYAV